MSDMVERVARAIEGVRLFTRWNDWTSDHVPGFPIEICRWIGEYDEGCEVIARYPGERESDGIKHLERHVTEARAKAAIAAMQADTAPVAMVRVTNGGYAMSLARYVAYSLPEGDHQLYAHPPVADRVSTPKPVDDRGSAKTSDKLRDAVEVYQQAYITWVSGEHADNAAAYQAAAAVIEADRAVLVAENERLRRALGKNAARFERCADMIADGGNPSGILRLERFLQAKQYATEARAALAGESHD